MDYDDYGAIDTAFDALYNSLHEEIKQKNEANETEKQKNIMETNKAEKHAEIKTQLAQCNFLVRQRKHGSLYQNLIRRGSNAVKAHTFASSCELEYPNILDTYLPVLSMELQLKYSLHFGGNSGCCSCSGCKDRFSHGGWVKQLAYVILHKMWDGQYLRGHALKSLETLERVFSSGDHYCTNSYRIAMAAKVAIEYAVTPASGYTSSRAARLQHLCLGIVRFELGRRLVENGCIEKVENETPTRRMFETILTDLKSCLGSNECHGRERANELQSILGEQFLRDSDILDPLAWEEIQGSLKNELGTFGSGRHIFGAWALFEGRCEQTDINSDTFAFLLQGVVRN